MASIPVDSVPIEDRFVAIRFKQTTDSYLIRFLILAAFRFLKITVDSIRFDSKRFCFFRFRTGSIPYVQRFRFLNRFGTILLCPEKVDPLVLHDLGRFSHQFHWLKRGKIYPRKCVLDSFFSKIHFLWEKNVFSSKTPVFLKKWQVFF